MFEFKITKPKDGYIRVYSYETYDSELDMWKASSLNWTTAEAFLAFCTSDKWYNTWRVVFKDIEIQEIIRRPNMPFISDYVRYELGILSE